MSLDRYLRNTIPLADAAAFFVGLKKFATRAPTASGVADELAQYSREEQLEILKEAGVSADELSEMLKEAATGKERAHANLEAKFETDKHTREERGGHVAGSLLGAAAGGAAGHRYGKSPAMALGSAALGAHLGGKVGKHVGRRVDEHAYSKKHAEAFKRALKEVDVPSMVEAEHAAAAEQEVGEAQFFRQRAQQLQAELEMAQQGASGQQEQQMALQQQVQGHDQQLQQALQQAQMTQQAALANVQQAHQVATQATQQAMQATDESLKHQQMAAAMRMAFQEMRGNMMDVASQDTAADVGAQLSGASMETPPPVPAAPGDPAADPAAASASAGAPADAAAAEGTPEAPTAAPPQEASPEPAGEAGMKEASMKERLPYAAAGAMLGGGMTAMESQRGHQGLRDKVQRLEGSKGGFSHALDLASAKAMLAAGELAEKHPMGATLAGSLMGAGMMAGAGPELAAGGKKLVSRMAG